MMPIVIPKIFTKKQCENIISYHSNWSENIGSVGKKGTITDDRQCLTYVPPSIEYIPNWLSTEIYKIIFFVNEESYNFDLNETNLQLHILRYDLGGHYKAHIDIGADRTAKTIFNRKLSFSLYLNDSYEGGNLRFFGLDGMFKNLEVGDILIFPSYLVHMVEPVTSGVRWVLVGWILGNKHFR